MHQLVLIALFIVSGSAASLPPPAGAVTAREVLDQAKQLDDTTRKWTDRVQTMTLRIHGKGGGVRERTLKVFDKRYGEGEDKAASFFLAPPDVKGTGFLQWAHQGRDDDQWLYLPELKRTRRITSRLRDQSFMGTDFTYRDLELLGEIQDWTEAEAPSKLVGTETIEGQACHVIELRPQQADRAYAKIMMWMDQAMLVARKLDFYDAQDAHVKTLAQLDVRDIGPIPTPHRLEMRNVKKGSHTEVALTDVRYDSGVPDDLFTERQLNRGAP
jgi:outer membrane lipoprotein-sorting protein